MYPTKKQILDPPHQHKPEVLALVKDWKKTVFDGKWGSATPNEKLGHIIDLLTAINQVYGAADLRVRPDLSDYYHRPSHTIALSQPSIITALHELGHHLFGASELKACRWSVWLFIKVFPKQYAKLVWDGHMLRRARA